MSAGFVSVSINVFSLFVLISTRKRLSAGSFSHTPVALAYSTKKLNFKPPFCLTFNLGDKYELFPLISQLCNLLILFFVFRSQ